MSPLGSIFSSHYRHLFYPIRRSLHFAHRAVISSHLPPSSQIHMAYNRVINFNAGPPALPLSVLEEAAKGLFNFEQTGIGIAEIAHRSKEVRSYMDKLELQIRTQLEVPPTHKILFTQGGGRGQFASAVYNMLARHWLLYPEATERRLEYVVTGSWSKAAMEESARLCRGPRGVGGTVGAVVDARRFSIDGKSFDNIPPHAQFAFSSMDSAVPPAMIYYCDNETIDGVQFSDDPASPAAFPFGLLNSQGGASRLLPLVADHSSSFMSRPIPHLADHAVIYAGAQKNVGPAGLTILIVREDCLVDPDSAALLGAAPIPMTMSYKTMADNKSLFHTPPVLSIYITGLVLERLGKLGGLSYVREVSRKKQEKVYAVVEAGEQLGIMKLRTQKGSRSWMNVVFDVLGEGVEQRFLEGAQREGMAALKGHPAAGGVRVSLYNAITEENTDKLINYMRRFLQEETRK